MHKTEDHHHSPEQVTEYVAQAKAICDEAPLLEEERIALLPMLVSLLSAKQIFYEQAMPVPDLSRLGVRH